jgi:maleate cis-trans isomerase
MWNINELTVEIMERMNSDVEQAARYLAQAKMDLIVYACTTGSFFKGPGYDDELIQCIEKAAGVPAVATAPAAAQALRFLGAKRISVASPYTQWQNEKLRVYYEAVGFEVLNVEGDPRGAVAGGQGHCDLTPESVLEFASGVCRPEADALFCSCTAWRSMEVAAELERRTGKPVVSANQATVWAAFRRLGITSLQPGFGSLLDNLARISV